MVFSGCSYRLYFSLARYKIGEIMPTDTLQEETPSRLVRTFVASVVIVVWLGILIYDVLTPTYEMPVQLFALGVGIIAYLLGISVPSLLGKDK